MSSEMKRVPGELARLIFFFSAFLIVGIVIFTLPRLTIPLGLAYVLYLIVNPIIPRIMKFGLSRSLAIGVAFFCVLFLVTFPVIKIVPMMVGEAETFSRKIGGIEKYLTANYQMIREKVKVRTGFDIGDKALNGAISVGHRFTTTFLKVVPNYLASILEWIFIIPLFLFFFLKDGRKFKFLMLKFTPNKIFERSYHLVFQLNKQLGGYIFAKFVEASIVGIVITSGLLILDVKFSLLLGIVAGVTNIIPYVGPFLGVVPAVLIGLADYGLSAEFGAIMMLYVIANVIDIAIVFPILVSKIVDIHPIVVVISVVLGSTMFGLIGMVVSIPMVAALKLLFTEVYRELYITHRK